MQKMIAKPTYLFDASAAVEFYCSDNPRNTKIIQHMVDQRRVHRNATLYLPNFCIAEVFNALGRWHFKDQKLNRSAYKDAITRFREDIRWGRLFYPYDLNRYHILAADDIIPVEHELAISSEGDHLSTFDILVIAMACELAYLLTAEDVFLITCDKRIKKVSDQLRRTEDGRKQERRVNREIGEPGKGRWVVPTVIYVPEAGNGEIPVVTGQSRLNV